MFSVTFCQTTFKDGKRWHFPGGLDVETGERIVRVGYRDGETTDPFDVFVYTDGRRVIPFIFADHMDFGEAKGVTLASVYISGIGADLKLQKSHTFHDYISYDSRWFADAAFHGYRFSSESELTEVSAKIRGFMRDWLFRQLAPQATKTSHAHMVARLYFPCYVAEALTEDQATPDNTYDFKRRDQYFRLLSAYRGPFIEWGRLTQRRQMTGKTFAPSGMEKRSPWGRKLVDAIIKDCAEMRSTATREAGDYIDRQTRQQINSDDEFFAALTSVDEPFGYEKLTALMLRCESLPDQPYRMGPDPRDLLLEERGVDFLRKFSVLDSWASTEHLLAHLVTLWTNRTRDRTGGAYRQAKKGIVGPAMGVGGTRLDGSTYP